jgi:hypothetical protein
VLFTGAHDANALAVANGKVDAATIADRILDAAIAKGHIKADQIEVVWEFRADPRIADGVAQGPVARDEGQGEGGVPGRSRTSTGPTRAS